MTEHPHIHMENCRFETAPAFQVPFNAKVRIINCSVAVPVDEAVRVVTFEYEDVFTRLADA